MIKHENSYESNPINKKCITCDWKCNVQPIKEIVCSDWKNIKFERTKKLEILKNKIKK